MRDMFSLKDRVALVTGASRGLGAALAEAAQFIELRVAAAVGALPGTVPEAMQSSTNSPPAACVASDSARM